MAHDTVTIDFVDILKLAGFDPARATKLVRHPDSTVRSLGLREQERFEIYQAYQSEPRFDDVEQIVAFRGSSGTRATFDGVYTVHGRRPANDGPGPQDLRGTAQWFYELRRERRYDHLQHRLVIDWGDAARSWHQRLDIKPVLELLPPGRSLEPFTDYLEFDLTYGQLRTLFEREDAHRDWQAPLSAVAGVYLILAEHSGAQYVGSASGAEGIWGRWRQYAKLPGHAGNAHLRTLVEGEPEHYPEQFRFSVLHVLPKTMKREDVIDREARYKRKLGTRATGLNSN
jgi:hypothetical protein